MRAAIKLPSFQESRANAPSGGQVVRYVTSTWLKDLTSSFSFVLLSENAGLGCNGGSGIVGEGVA
jgi:hypothetical protein